jgi:hypothetical protein
MVSGALPQRGYLWQRDWTPAVDNALVEAKQHFGGVVLLGAEIEWSGQTPRVVRANIDWEEVRRTEHGRCSLALRVAPFAFPKEGAPRLRAIESVARSLVAEADAHHVAVQEFQLDYDCAQRNLGAYRAWLQQLRSAIHPVRFVITTLPSWLDESEFAALVREVDGYVLQVHSVPLGGARGGALCDPKRARQWVLQAARLRRPFSVALPTYRCTAGYDQSGRLIGIAMDSVQPAWPPNTRVLEYSANANALADLVHDWQRERPAEMCELHWYRIPVATDTRNWRWPTLVAVMSGRRPEPRFAILRDGANPIDLSLVNEGETDEDLQASVVASWSTDELVAADALAGWQVEAQPRRAVFTVATGHHLRLPPGARRRIGWLRDRGMLSPTLTYENETAALR